MVLSDGEDDILAGIGLDSLLLYESDNKHPMHLTNVAREKQSLAVKD
jgi:hypothetical protein